ncbi:LysE family transporter [Geopsychrobacter electrodiphilus]|uniref:LysE family transporter n=1 Tax=Geopsychrobacter electrodiphilus TaxID=225196 RepID=UPI00036F70EE|nr:LysE family transporter [Geopsychrobacter electrodiphilus]
MNWWAEFLTIALVHLLAVASPGPDFAMVMRQSIVCGRRPAIYTSIGIGTGILVHVSYCLLGLGLLISRSLLLFNLVKLVGAAYLLYIGWHSLRAQPTPQETKIAVAAQVIPSASQALRIGFLTNLLNPKATLFFLSLFSLVISPQTPLWVQLGYGVYMALATGLWFSALSVFLTRPAVRGFFRRFGHWAERLMGGVLIALGIKLALTQR